MSKPSKHSANMQCIYCIYFFTDCANSDEDWLTTIAAVGITFVLTLIVTIFITLLIVHLVHKKKGAAKKKIIGTQNPTAVPSTDKCGLSAKKSEVYEFPDNFTPSEEDRYQKHPGAALQRNPAYGVEKYDTIKDAPLYEDTTEYETSPVYENLK